MTVPKLPGSTYTQDERVMAALAHACSILSIFGTIGSIVIWLTQKDKSRYVAFQALQAIVYHICLIVGWFFFMVCYMSSAIAFLPLSMASAPAVEGESTVSWFVILLMAAPIGIMVFMLILWLLYMLYGMYAAASTLQGKDFRYVVIGNRLEKYLD